jgi:3-hydroxybutyrate dehydrogenase
MKLINKVAVVTGGGSGIGLAVVERFLGEGASVAVNDVDEDSAREGLSNLSDSTGNFVFIKGDVSDAGDCRGLIESAVGEFGGVDILVNNAGLQHVAPLMEFPEERWEHLLSVMLSGAFYCTKYALPHMIKRGGGRIINMSSMYGLTGVKYKAAYVTAKHGLLGLTKVTALEHAEDNITANAVCPSFVRTPLLEKQLDDQARAHGIDREEVIEKVILADAPVKRLLDPEEVAELCLYLTSEPARNISGAAIPIDIGSTAG